MPQRSSECRTSCVDEHVRRKSLKPSDLTGTMLPANKPSNFSSSKQCNKLQDVLDRVDHNRAQHLGYSIFVVAIVAFNTGAISSSDLFKTSTF